MSDVKTTTAQEKEPSTYGRLPVVLSAVSAALLLFVGWFYASYYQSRIGVAQPIPFSHCFHADEKQISCFVCHPGAKDTARAGVPPLETCMLCHDRVIITYPQIATLRQHYFDGEPIEWERVTSVPDYVYFSHERHIQRAIDCGKCHGDVKMMDRIDLAYNINMGFCVQCHRDNGVSHDCAVCHR